MFCFIPMATGNIIPGHNITHYGKSDRKYIDKPEYTDFKTAIIQEKLNYKIMRFPGDLNYQILFKTGENSYYTGWSPLLKNINKGFLQPFFDSHIAEFYSFLSQDSAQKIFGMLNIGKILVNPDSIPWYGKLGTGDLRIIRKRFGIMEEERFGNMSVFNNHKNFLPIVYSPRKIFIVQN